jgi:ribonuclease Z
MRPLLHPTLINGRSGDPAVYVETLFDRPAILLDLGDITLLSPRKILRVGHVFVSHTHIDHFIAFDHLLRVLVGRDKNITLYGPQGFIDQVHHKLHAYRWNLVDRYLLDLVIVVNEIVSPSEMRAARFRLKSGFAEEPVRTGPIVDGVICREPSFRVSTAILEHRTPCLGFAIEEAAHVNVWKNRLAELGLPVGPWLHELKQAVIESRPADQISLVRNADMLFIEAAFAKADAALAAERAHLTTAAAGTIAREAGARRVEPFHFSPRYEGQEERMVDEVMAAFTGDCSNGALW